MASKLVVFNASVSLNLWLLRSLTSTYKSVHVRWWKHVAFVLIAATVRVLCATPLELLNTEFLLISQNSWDRLASAVDAHEVVIAALKARN